MSAISTPSDSKYIYLYADPETSYPLSVEHLERSLKKYLGEERSPQIVKVDSDSIISGKLKVAKALVIPGGNAAMMAGKLKKNGMANLSDFFTKQKGNGLGICAGAYLISSHKYYNGFNEDPKITNPLKLYDATPLSLPLLQGPAIPLGKDAVHLCNHTIRSVAIRTLEAAFPVLWNGGGAWEEANLHLTKEMHLAKYAGDLALGDCAAIFSTQNGSNIVLSGVHPELQLSLEELNQQFPHLGNKEELIKAAPLQQKFFNTLCETAGI